MIRTHDPLAASIAHRLRAALAASLIPVLLAGCAAGPPPHFDLTPTRSNGQDLAGMGADTILESRQPGGIVSLRADPGFANFGAGFLIAVRNMGEGPVSFGPADIRASAGGRPLDVLAAAELERRVAGDARSYIQATDLTGSVDIERATPDVAREYRFNNYGGCPAGQSGCQIYSASNGRDYRLDRQNRELQAQTVADAAVMLQMNRDVIATRALKPATLGPEQMSGGAFVVVPPREGGPIDLVVTFAGRTHSFTFAAAPTPDS